MEPTLVLRPLEHDALDALWLGGRFRLPRTKEFLELDVQVGGGRPRMRGLTDGHRSGADLVGGSHELVSGWLVPNFWM